MRSQCRLAAPLAFACLAPAAALAAPDTGEGAFQKCYSCHSVQPGETGLQGPNLRGVVGRAAAAQPEFEYSPAMSEAGRGGLV